MLKMLKAFGPSHKTVSAGKTPPAAVSSPRSAFFDIVDEVTRSERMPFHLAMAKVRSEHPQVYRDAFVTAR